jgi:hypothetical protein
MNVRDCLQCDAGEYCGEKNMTAPTGIVLHFTNFAPVSSSIKETVHKHLQL